MFIRDRLNTSSALQKAVFIAILALGCKESTDTPNSDQLIESSSHQNQSDAQGKEKPPNEVTNTSMVRRAKPGELRALRAPINPPPEHAWIEECSISSAKALLDGNRSHATITDSNGRTALHWAARLGCYDIIPLLIEYGANIDAKDNKSRTPLDFTMDFLYRTSGDDNQSASVNREIEASGGPFASQQLPEAYDKCILILIENGADLNATDSLGRTPIYTAVLGGHLRILKILLDAGADVSHRDIFGKTVCDLFKTLPPESSSGPQNVLGSNCRPGSGEQPWGNLVP